MSKRKGSAKARTRSLGKERGSVVYSESESKRKESRAEAFKDAEKRTINVRHKDQTLCRWRDRETQERRPMHRAGQSLSARYGWMAFLRVGDRRPWRTLCAQTDRIMSSIAPPDSRSFTCRSQLPLRRGDRSLQPPLASSSPNPLRHDTHQNRVSIHSLIISFPLLTAAKAATRRAYACRRRDAEAKLRLSFACLGGRGGGPMQGKAAAHHSTTSQPPQDNSSRPCGPEWCDRAARARASAFHRERVACVCVCARVCFAAA